MNTRAKTTTVNDLFYLINCSMLRTHVDSSLQEIAENLCRSSYNKVYLEDDNDRLCGIIQARHVALKILQLSPAESEFEDFVPVMMYQLTSIHASELATPASTVKLSDSLKTVLEVMGDQNVREVAVLDEAGRLVGTLEGKTILAYYLNKKTHALGQAALS